MNAVVIYGAAAPQDYGLSTVMQTIYTTLKELGIDVSEWRIAEMSLPFFNGLPNESVEVMMASLASADAILFAYTTHFYSPSASIKCFMEYFDLPQYKNFLRGKNCMNITVCEGVGEKTSADIFSKILSSLGASDQIKLAIGGSYQKEIGRSEFLQEVIEKSVEDYYRIFKAKRKFLFSSDISTGAEAGADIGINYAQNLYAQPPVQNTFQASPVYYAPEESNKQSIIPPIYTPQKNGLDTPPLQYDDSNLALLGKKLSEALEAEIPTQPQKSMVNQLQNDYSSFSNKQEQDIQELTRLFSKKAVGKEPQQREASIGNNIYLNERTATYSKPMLTPGQQPVMPRSKTCKQMVMSLPHYYQTHLAGDIECIIQLNITGTEAFDCYLALKATETRAIEGIYPNSDIVITTDSNTLTDILKGKYTAQKAFITGQLKVRGNFMLLNKFDTLYKKM